MGSAQPALARVLCILPSRQSRPSSPFVRRALTTAWPRGESLHSRGAGLFRPGERQQQPSAVPASCRRLHQSIPGSPAPWALPPPSNPGCGRSRLRSGFGLSSSREAVGDCEGPLPPGRQCSRLQTAPGTGGRPRLGIEVKALGQAWRAHRRHRVKSHVRSFVHSTNTYPHLLCGRYRVRH